MNPLLFHAQTWVRDDRAEERKVAFAHFTKIVESLPWNTEGTVPILPTLHGTARPISSAICETGFASLSLLDDGWYGRGIYFTMFQAYAIPYIITSKAPVFVVSWVLPGNVYPVVEVHTEADSLLGSALQPGYNCHYVTTSTDGRPVKDPNHTPVYNELVIPQESQITPAFILELDTKELRAAGVEWGKILKKKEGPHGIYTNLHAHANRASVSLDTSSVM